MREKIDINVADVETLTAISGIGPALAQRIIEYRETVHPFEEVIELAAVPGISEKMVRGFAEWVTVVPTLPRTAVSHEYDDDLEDMPFTLEPVELLEAPEQPATGLAAKLPEIEEIVADEAATAEEPLADVEDEIGDSITEETAVPEPVETLEEAVQTADAQPDAATMPTVESALVFTPEPTPETAVPPQAPVNWDAKARRRGCLSTLLGATFGAILGAVLTLAVLAALNNGSINYAATDSAIQRQLNTEIISRTDELNQLSTRVSIVTMAEAEANQTLQTNLEAANQEIADNEEIISYLATRNGDLELRLQDVAGAADTFISFLDGLRLLLGDLDESSPTPRPAAGTITPTPLSQTTPLPAPTTAVQPTRTPQPTATPFTFPTNTPAPQP